MVLKQNVNAFISSLVHKYKEISEIWLIGSRANNKKIKPDSDWDFIVFTEIDIGSRLSKDEELQNRAKTINIDLLVEKDKKYFESPWEKKSISKEEMKWCKISNRKVKYWAAMLREITPEEEEYMTGWERDAIQHGANSSIDISDWRIGIKIWPTKGFGS